MIDRPDMTKEWPKYDLLTIVLLLLSFYSTTRNFQVDASNSSTLQNKHLVSTQGEVWF